MIATRCRRQNDRSSTTSSASSHERQLLGDVDSGCPWPRLSPLSPCRPVQPSHFTMSRIPAVSPLGLPCKCDLRALVNANLRQKALPRGATAGPGRPQERRRTAVPTADAARGGIASPPHKPRPPGAVQLRPVSWPPTTYRGRAMRHATADDLEQITGLLGRLRSVGGLVERTPGVFYRRSRAFLHFHEDAGSCSPTSGSTTMTSSGSGSPRPPSRRTSWSRWPRRWGKTVGLSAHRTARPLDHHGRPGSAQAWSTWSTTILDAFAAAVRLVDISARTRAAEMASG